MTKKEKIIVFGTGLVLLLIFTFTDLPISMAIARKPWIARVLEVIGEIPFTLLTLSGCAMGIRFRKKGNKAGSILSVLGFGLLFLLFAFMGGFMTFNYLSRNIPGTTQLLIPVLGIVFAAAAILTAKAVPEENREHAMQFAVTALIYFVLVILVMNVLKTMWGRMRFREMTDPAAEFTRWYQICGRGSFSDVYASFPSGHSMNSAAVVLLLMFPDIFPALKGKERAIRTAVYVWCVVVGSSRVMMGAHFASDVTVGIMLSLALFEIVRTVVCKIYNRRIRAHSQEVV